METVHLCPCSKWEMNPQDWGGFNLLRMGAKLIWRRYLCSPSCAGECSKQDKLVNPVLTRTGMAGSAVPWQGTSSMSQNTAHCMPEMAQPRHCSGISSHIPTPAKALGSKTLHTPLPSNTSPPGQHGITRGHWQQFSSDPGEKAPQQPWCAPLTRSTVIMEGSRRRPSSSFRL